jgi:membrane protease YdiL (CAAX protease family)
MVRRVLTLDRPLIGTPLARPAGRAALAITIALLALAADYWIVWRLGGAVQIRAIPPVIALLVYLWLGDGDWRAVGLRLVPEPRLRFWAWMLVVTVPSVAFVAGLGVAYAYYKLHTGRGAVGYLLDPAHFWRAFGYACLLYPLLEEAIFRAALCTPLAPVIGPWPTVLLSGALFAAVHFLYGNPGVDNFLAGYFLAWAYLKSGSIVVPAVLHALGNLVILVGQMAAWTLTTPG